MPGFESTAFLIQAISNFAKSIVYFDNFFFEDGSSLFVDYPNQKGTQLKFPIEYSWTSNGGTFNYDDAMPESDASAGEFAYFTKDQWQKSVRLYNTLKAYNIGSGDSVDNTTLGTALSNDKIFMNTIKAMRAQMMSTFISDLEGQIDSAGSYSDASLLRATYGLASYEYDASSSAITLDMLDDMIEALMTSTYGASDLSDLVFLAPPNQTRKIGDLESRTVGTTIIGSNLGMNADSQNMAPIDAGMIMRTKTYNGIPIINVRGMTNTNLLLVKKGSLKRCIWRPLETEDKTAGVAADQQLYHIKMGANVFCDEPSHCGKISGLTA